MIGRLDGSLGEIASSSALDGRILAVRESEAQAREDLEKFISSCAGSVPVNPMDAMKLLRGHEGGFLSASTASLLEAGDFEAVYEESMARLYSISAPLFPVKEDPFGFAGEWAMSRIGGTGSWRAFGGIASCTRESKGFAIATRRYASIKDAARDLERIELSGDFLPGGTAFHSASATSRSVAEVNVLGIVGIISTILIGWWLFGGLGFAPSLAGTVAIGFVAASAAVFLIWPKPHVVTFLFGTTLAGLGVDYAYHSRAEGRRANADLAKSLATSVASFLPLLFAGAVALRQMALWTASGLVAMAAVLISCNRGEGRLAECRHSAPRFGRAGKAIVALAAIAALSGLIFVDFKSDVTSLYRPSPLLAEGERRIAELGGDIPTAEVQRRNVALKAAFANKMGARWTEDTGIPVSEAEVSIFDPRGELDAMFSESRREAVRLLLASFAALAVILLVAFGSRAIKVAFPVVAALALTLGSLGWMCRLTGGGIDFFQTICLFIIAGLGLDYSIFAQGGAPAARRTVIASALTSIVAFALLGFTSFAVTRGMGITLAIGLGWCLILALAGGKSVKGCSTKDGSADWHAQREQSAGRLRIAVLWWIYRIFGKGACKIAVAVVVAFVYPFARPARNALRAYYSVLGVKASHFRIYRHMLSFAWGMLDKTDACTLKRALPAMGVRDDASWRRFDSLIRSGKGAFIIGSHLGTMEVLPALASLTRMNPKVHAFQQMGHDAVFTRAFMKHFDDSSLVLHAVEDIGVETAVEMQQAIERGELAVMAGDRVSASNPRSVRKAVFLGRECLWPKGVFVFAKVLEAPVFYATCVRTGFNSYEVHVREGLEGDLLSGYVSFLEEELRAHPGEWFQFYDFFGLYREESVNRA